jgi:large subunit ribosomal protein L9
MEVILTEDVPNLGNMGELVKVKPGYGRNFLLPRGLAVQATPGNRKQIEHTLRQLEDKRARLRADAQGVAGQFEGLSVTLTRQAGEDDRLFGSVTNRDIEAALAAAGFTVDRRKIMLADPLRTLGIFEVPIRLHSEVTATIRVWICAA